MATHHEDFGHMRRSIDFAGDTLVDHGHHLAEPGPQHPDNVAAREEYEDHVGGPAPVRAEQDVHSSGATPKAFFQHPTSGRTWMLKPYHEGTEGLGHVAHYPLLGWSELTTQGLYHAGGIGDLVQPSHATMHPVSPTEHQPFVAISFDKKRNKPAWRFGSEHLLREDAQPRDAQGRIVEPLQHERPVGLYNDAAKIGFMDFLTNHQDRHADNLLWGHHGDENPTNLRALAIDNASAFQYKNAHFKATGHDSDKDHLLYYLLDSGALSALGKKGMGPWDNEHVAHATGWWQENSPFIRQEFERHLQAIKDKKVRSHLSRNFNERADTLDRFSVAFGAAPNLDLYSPYADKPRARDVAQAKVHRHQPVFPWAWKYSVMPEDHPDD